MFFLNIISSMLSLLMEKQLCILVKAIGIERGVNEIKDSKSLLLSFKKNREKKWVKRVAQVFRVFFFFFKGRKRTYIYGSNPISITLAQVKNSFHVVAGSLPRWA